MDERAALLAVGLVVAAGLARRRAVLSVDAPRSGLDYREWSGRMSPILVARLAEFERLLGRRVIVSPHPEALGRSLGLDSTSQHNIDMWGEVRAADVMLPEGPDLQTAYNVARRVGFTGMGAYPGWSPYPGLHLDVRTDRSAAAPATWSRVNGEYLGIVAAWV